VLLQRNTQGEKEKKNQDQESEIIDKGVDYGVSFTSYASSTLRTHVPGERDEQQDRGIDAQSASTVRRHLPYRTYVEHAEDLPTRSRSRYLKQDVCRHLYICCLKISLVWAVLEALPNSAQTSFLFLGARIFSF
jgi:hypothetical protein